MLKKLRRAVRSFEQKFEKRGIRSPLKKHPSLSQKVSLIVPTYNVELYIDDFLASVTSQTTGLRNLEVIIVDDGSTDRSGEIAQAWAKRFPKTIRYIRQENKGAAEARNTGLDHATGDWVSFPDPDDMLPRKWLNAFNREIQKTHELPLLIVSMPIQTYREKTGTFHSHPLRSLYAKRTVTQTQKMGDYILLSSAKTFFRRSEIERHSLRFDRCVRPSFEDGHFTTRLMALCPSQTIVRLPKPSYIYRKREAATSQLDGSKNSALWYTDQLRNGYLDLFNRTRDGDGKVPRFVQRTVLYSLGWRFRHLLNHAERAAHLTDDQRAEFLDLVRKIFAYIDAGTIRTMNLGGLHEEYKIGLLAMYKADERATDVVYLTQYDERAQALQFSCYNGGDATPNIMIFVDGLPADRIWCSRRVSTFLDAPFYSEHRCWVDVHPGCELRATINGRPARIRSNGRTLGDRVSLRQAISSLRPRRSSRLPVEARRLRDYATSDANRARFANCWVLMDRDDVADDNAEHLYRYMLRNGMAGNAYFILREDSSDWQRLQDEGFRLLPFASDDHVAALINADLLISSHIDHFVLWPVAKSWIQDLVQYQYIFLQHGVTKDDLSGWLNSKPIRILATTSNDEWRSIVVPDSNYFFTEREAKLSGFPRHDALLMRPQRRDTILVMPTWRRYLVGETVGAGMKRNAMSDFMESDYAKAWRALLTSDCLRLLAERHGKEIVFCPHPNMAMYLDELGLPAYIRCRDPRQPPSIQETFAEAAMMITDYSSVAFDCAYIDRPIAYYQFDREEFFSGDHVYTKGYFDYRDDGFGPVAETQDEVLDAIEKALEGNEDPVYAQRRESFFAFRDGRCCERVYNAIRELLPEESAVEQLEQIAAE